MGVTPVASSSVGVNSSVAATGAPLRSVALGTGRAGEREVRWADRSASSRRVAIVVRINIMFLSLMVVAVSAAALAQPLPELERILLPVVTRTPVDGAHGSRWEAVVTVRNASGQSTFLFPPDCPLFPPIPEKFCAQGVGTEFPAGAVKRVDLLVTRGQVSPVFLNVTKSLAHQLFVQLRVHDLTRQSDNFGTEIPVIRSSEMKMTAGEILDIPRDSRFRLAFRLYGDKVERDSEIVVRFVNQTTNQKREMSYSILPQPSGIPPGEPVTVPPLYREIPDFDLYPEMQNAQAIYIEIEPQTPGVRYWAFVSVTNNETQQITTLSVH
jgi:hypothetical protein